MNDVVSTGSLDLNKWLSGGYEKGVVTMIVGPPASGKSNFSMLAACSSAVSGKVIFIDTEGGFSVERVRQIVGSNYEEILENILLFSPLDFKSQRESFAKLEKYLKGGSVSMIVVDSIAMLYRLEISGLDTEGISRINCEMSNQMNMLVAIARREMIPVIVTNQVYFEFLKEFDFNVDRKMNIVGGDVFRYFSKCIIELKNKRGRMAKLLKHRYLPESELYFEIRNDGVFRRRGFF